MEKNNNVVDGVIEQVEKGEKIKEKAIKKIKQDKDVRKYASDVFSLIVGFLSFLLILEVPDIVSITNNIDSIIRFISIWSA